MHIASILSVERVIFIKFNINNSDRNCFDKLFYLLLISSKSNIEKSILSLRSSLKILSCNCATLYSFNKSKGLFIVKPPKSKVAISYAYFEAWF